MINITTFLAKVRNLSLDVVLGVMSTSMMICLWSKSDLNLYVFFSLGLSTWIIYTVDHLVDAEKSVKKGLPISEMSSRHRFHATHSRLLWRAVAVCIAAVVCCVFYVQLTVVILAGLVGVMSLFYLVLVHYLNLKKEFVKEFWVAIIYAMAVMIPAVSVRLPIHFIAPWGIVFGQIVFLALSNLLIISTLEVSIDKKNNFASFPLLFGVKLTEKLTAVLLLLVAMTAVFGSFIFDTDFAKMQIIICAMSLTLSCILAYLTYFLVDEQYRIWADMVFMYPVIFYFL